MPSSTPPPPLVMERPAVEEAPLAINAQPRIAANALPEEMLKGMASVSVEAPIERRPEIVDSPQEESVIASTQDRATVIEVEDGRRSTVDHCGSPTAGLPLDVFVPTGPGDNGQLLMLVSGHMVGRVIGKSGATIRELQGRTGASISLPKSTSTDATSRVIHIAGTAHQVSHCHLLLKLKLAPRDNAGYLRALAEQLARFQVGACANVACLLPTVSVGILGHRSPPAVSKVHPPELVLERRAAAAQPSGAGPLGARRSCHRQRWCNHQAATGADGGAH